MLQLHFEPRGEIRMGSPYQLCSVQIEGPWVPDLTAEPVWSNVYGRSPDSTVVALVQWDIVRNDPGFRVVTLDSVKRTVQTSGRLVGICESLMWVGAHFIPFVKA